MLENKNNKTTKLSRLNIRNEAYDFSRNLLTIVQRDNANIFDISPQASGVRNCGKGNNKAKVF